MRGGAVYALGDAFSQVSDKIQAWKDLLTLTQDKSWYIRGCATMVLGKVFSQVPDKTQAWKDLFRLTQDKDRSVRGKAAWSLGKVFRQVPDKTQAWQDLHRLTQDEKSDMRGGAAQAIGMAFSQVPDKTQVWQDLHRLTHDEDCFVRSRTAYPLGSLFGQAPDKTQVWQDLHWLALDDDSHVRSSAAEALRIAFSQILDKAQAWQDLHRLTHDEDSEVRWRAAHALGTVFGQVPDKIKAWQDLHRLAQDEDSYRVRTYAAQAFAEAFNQVPDKTQAWQDLHRLTLDEDNNVRSYAVYALGETFNQVLDKTQAWQDLHRLTLDEDSHVRSSAVYALKKAFSQVPDKAQAWQDIHRLTLDENINVRGIAAKALGNMFSQVPDKNQAWQDIHRLTLDENINVRGIAAKALGNMFSQVPDKVQAWQDLHRLTQDRDGNVRLGSSEALGEGFSQFPDKAQAWQDLLDLTLDEKSDVRIYAYHSLGRASISNAIWADDKDKLKMELEAAVAYFKKSSQEQSYDSPAQFCYPFYRTYLAITFQETKEDEIQEYILEVKSAIDSSMGKTELLEAIDNLAKALQESQKLKSKSLDEIANELNAYKWYCDKAAEHMAAAEDKAPGAVRLLRKCNPIIEERIEATIAGIQKTAREICQVTHGSGTKYEAPGAQINREAKSLSSDNPIKAFKSSTRIATIIREVCNLLPREKRRHACEIVDEIEAEQELSSRLCRIELALTYLMPNIDMAAHESATKNKLEEIHSDMKSMDTEIVMTSKTPIVFISYAREDLSAAKRLNNDLKSKGVDTWVDYERILSGEKWKIAINKAIKKSSYFIAVLSSISVEKKGIVQWEIASALEVLDQYPQSKIFVIPVRLDECKPNHEKLEEIHWTDMFPDWKQGIEKILFSIQQKTRNK
jgi:HEAT repeat protein